MESDPLARLQAEVAADPALQNALIAAPQSADFVAVLQRISEERGCPLTAFQIEAALRAAHQAWLLRWLEE